MIGATLVPPLKVDKKSFYIGRIELFCVFLSIFGATLVPPFLEVAPLFYLGGIWLRCLIGATSVIFYERLPRSIEIAKNRPRGKFLMKKSKGGTNEAKKPYSIELKQWCHLWGKVAPRWNYSI